MIWIYFSSLLCAFFVAFLLRRSKGPANPRRLPPPPGPKGWPIIGNLFDAVAMKVPWLKYADWGKEYRGMVYYRLMSQSVLVLTSAERCSDLLEKRSSIYSGRPRTTMISDILGTSEWALSLQNYGPTWRHHRRVMQDHFRPAALEEYKPIIKREARRLLRRLLESPHDFKNHVRLSFASGNFDIIYGLNVDRLDHPIVADSERVTREVTNAAQPGSYLVDVLPILKYVPSWMPGARFKRLANELVELQQRVIQIPFNEMLLQMNSGSDEGSRINSIAAKLYRGLPSEDAPNYRQDLDTAKHVTATSFLAGSDTTLALTLIFILAMALHPEVVRKAHEEIDSVTEGLRLPDFSDRERLVYVSAILKEVQRWQVIVPIALPHLLTEDDEYDGYFIPKGTVVVGNAWSVLHDEEAYPDPMTFKPERFIKDGKLDPSVRDPASAAFGFGRRVCPGRHMAMESLWMTVASLLAVYDILPPLNGKPLECKMTSGIISHPEEYECRFVPRNSQAESLISSLSLETESE